MYKALLTLSVLIIVNSSSLFAQKCATSLKVQEKIEQNPNYLEYRKDLEAYTENYIQSQQEKNTNAVITIPMVVHILHKGGADNISDAQVLSQLSVLNDDFRKLNSNFSSTPTPFQALAADVEIEFCLASIDPNGNATSGITRKEVANNFDTEFDYYTSGGIPAWNSSRYLNVWIVDLGSDLLGFAYTPGAASSDEDGVVIDDNAWGTIGTAANNQPNHLGRTATHEIGHYFNLEHLWGRNGGCGDDDFVNDTPAQDSDSFGCSSFPRTDNCTSSGDGIMFVNYMDYSDDDCMSMFTLGQKTRMLAALNGPRSGLKTSNGCDGNPNNISTLANPIEIAIFPNPSSNFCFINVDKFENIELSIYNLNGQVVYTKHLFQSRYKINTSDWANGLYLVKLKDNSTNLTETYKLVIN